MVYKNQFLSRVSDIYIAENLQYSQQSSSRIRIPRLNRILAPHLPLRNRTLPNHHLHRRVIDHALDADFLAALHDIPVDIFHLRLPARPHVREHRADIVASRVRHADHQRLEALRAEALGDVGDVLEFRQGADDERCFGEEEAHVARYGEVVEDAAVSGVQEDCQWVED